MAPVRQDYNDFRHREGGRGEAERAGVSDGINLDALLEKRLLCIVPGKADRVT